MRLLALLLLCLLVPFIGAQEKPKTDPAKLTLERIFSNEFSGERQSSVQWLDKLGGYAVLESSKEQGGGRVLVRYLPESGDRDVLIPADRLKPTAESSALSIASYSFSPNEALVLIFTNTKRVWRQNTRGDYWIYDLTGRNLKKLGGDAPASSLMFAKFSPDSSRVAYVRDRNIYVENLKSGNIRKLTETKNKDIINGTFDWVYEEELGLQDGYRWSPDGKHIAYWQLNSEGVGTFHLINNTAGLYPKLYPIKYPKVGTTNSAWRLGVVRTDLPEDRTETGWADLSYDPRNSYLARMDWASEDAVIFQVLNRLQNTNHVHIMPLESFDFPSPSEPASLPYSKLQSGQPPIKEPGEAPLLLDKDNAWVDVYDHLEWINDDKEFTWVSERDGWRRVYRISRDGKSIQAITPEKMDVIEVVTLDHDNKLLYYYASPKNATQQYLWSSKLDGTGHQRITPEENEGWNTYNISPDGKYAIHTKHDFGTPPVTDLVKLPSHEVVRPLKENKKLLEKIEKLDKTPVELFQVEIGDGISLDAWCMKPPDFDAGKKYPVLFYVYGEPAGQTVLDSYRGSRYLWHLLLNQQGYIVMSVDNRGTPGPKGSAWRKVVYRKIGDVASGDQAAAIRALLKERPYMDPERIGVWGWSGGGTMSLHAIFRHPDLYSLAMSIAPVTNERYYDTIYSERYMGLPHDNVEGYKGTSPIHFAKNLKGDLLLVHGTGDDNVHYQSSEALVNELVEHNKQFSMMAYPNRTHSIREGRNTTKHLFTLLTRFLNRNMPASTK